MKSCLRLPATSLYVTGWVSSQWRAFITACGSWSAWRLWLPWTAPAGVVRGECSMERRHLQRWWRQLGRARWRSFGCCCKTFVTWGQPLTPGSSRAAFSRSYVSGMGAGVSAGVQALRRPSLLFEQ